MGVENPAFLLLTYLYFMFYGLIVLVNIISNGLLFYICEVHVVAVFLTCILYSCKCLFYHNSVYNIKHSLKPFNMP